LSSNHCTIEPFRSDFKSEYTQFELYTKIQVKANKKAANKKAANKKAAFAVPPEDPGFYGIGNPP